MQFETEAQRTCYERIAQWLPELFGELAQANSEKPEFSLIYGTAFVRVYVLPWGEEDAIINTRSYVATDTKITLDVARFLLYQNERVHFGAFGLDDEDDIFFQHAIVGSTCDKKELKASVMAVMRAADYYDDPIVTNFGGQRAVDRHW